MSFSIDLGKIKFHFRGDWSQTTTYERDDVVYRNGSSYVCVPKTSINVDPANNIDAQWRKVAQGSDVGATLINAGDMLYYDGTDFQRIAAPTTGKPEVLSITDGVPSYQSVRVCYDIHTYTDSISRTATTSYVDGMITPDYQIRPNTIFKVSMTIPYRNDSSSWGGAYTALYYSQDSGTNWVYCGTSGYDAVMINGSTAILTYANTMLIDPLHTEPGTIMFRTRFKTYDGTAYMNGNRDIGTGDGPDEESNRQFWSHFIIEEWSK